jgi:sugar O-acyltransferase (sialic acid O-acetyltransferase NeuD family)
MMTIENIIIVGARLDGQAGAVIDTLEEIGGYRLIGFIDSTPELQGKSIRGVPVIGSTEDLETLEIPECCLHIAIGDNKSRYKIYQILKKRKFKIATLVHPYARISKSASIGEGCFVSVNAVIRNGAVVGCASIINTSAIVEHDNKIGNAVHIAPGVHTGGCVHVADYSFIGLGSSILPNIKIGSGVVIGAGSTITKNISSNVVMVGYAAKPHIKNN